MGLVSGVIGGLPDLEGLYALRVEALNMKSLSKHKVCFLVSNLLIDVVGLNTIHMSVCLYHRFVT